MKQPTSTTALARTSAANGNISVRGVTSLPAAGAAKAALVRAGRAAPRLAYITKDEARAIGEKAGHQRPWRQRTRKAALLRFLWLTGARLSEALAVTPRDVDTAAGVVNVRTLKRRAVAYRAVPLPPDELAQLLYVASHHHVAPEAPLFPWSRPGAWRWIHRAMMAAGIEAKRAHPHAFRHGHAMHAFGAGAPPHVVQAQMGHASLVTTGIYAKAQARDIRAAYDRIDW